MSKKGTNDSAGSAVGDGGVSEYAATIGLEIHAELNTASKMFCSCKNDPDEERPNLNVCPICLGHPGTLPVLNHEAIKHVLKIGVAVGGKLADFTEWDRKQYFYPDIPKGYQISQYAYPLVSGGTLAGVELERIHLEEDTAQSTHDTHDKSLINFNRSGVPLMELVTKPVIHDSDTAVRFAKELQLLLRYLGAGEANMEKGEMRVEANISVARKSSDELGTKTEVKNLNSFRAVHDAIDFEIRRQIKLIESGDRVTQETRGWDDRKAETYSQRSKESAHDYRYFPDPDIPKMKISEIDDFDYQSLRESLPELPWQKRDRYKSIYGATDKEAELFVDNHALAKYFESITTSMANAGKESYRLLLNYLLTDYLGILKKAGKGIDEAKIRPKHWCDIVKMIEDGQLSSRGAKDLIAVMAEKGDKEPKTVAEEGGLIQKNDMGAIVEAIKAVISENKGIVEEYRGGKVTAINFLVGQVMKRMRGAGNPKIVTEEIKKQIDTM